MSDIKKVFIVGGCVSRDIFNLEESRGFEVVDYVARTSFASLVGKPMILEDTLNSIGSNWQRRMVELDMSKGLISKVKNKSFDILLIDFLNIRLSLAADEQEGYLFTASSEFKAAKKSLVLKTIPKYTGRYFELWTEGFRRFAEVVKQKRGLKIYVNELYWAGEANLVEFGGRYSEEDIWEANENLKKCYSYARKVLPDAEFISYPKDVLSPDPKHKWGVEPFHYKTDVYQHGLRKMLEIEPKVSKYDGLPSISDTMGRRLFYSYTPATSEDASPLLVILHGHTHNASPSRYKDSRVNVLVPVDNFGVDNSGSWWLGEDGEFFVKDLLHSLIKERLSKSNGSLYFWGSSMGGYGALLHGMLLGAKAVYANIPQIKLLGSTYSEAGMKKFFNPVFGGNVDSIYNDLTKVLEHEKEKEGDKIPLFFLGQSRFDYKNYLEEQSHYFFKKCLDLDVNISYEIFPKKGHGLMIPAHEAIEKMLGYCERSEDRIDERSNRRKCMTAVVFGIMNFSVLYSKTNAFKASKKEYEEYKETILNPERLKVREDIFFNYTVPSVVRSYDEYKDAGIVFVFNVAVSDQLPQYLLDRFEDLEEKHRDLFNVVKVTEDEPHSWKGVLESELSRITGFYYFKEKEVIFLNFRLDDDDIVSPGYFRAISKYLNESYEEFYLTFPKGFVGVYDDGFEGFYEIHKPYLAIGLSKVCKYSLDKGEISTPNPVVSSVPHTIVSRNSKTILDSTFSAYIWTMHKFSDTRSNDVSHRVSSSKIKRFIEDNELVAAESSQVETAFELSFHNHTFSSGGTDKIP